MRMARSIPFSGEMRPRKAKYSGDAGTGCSSVGESPCSTVATQLRSGIGFL